MKFAAVTTCHLAGYNLYGANMLDSFTRHWPNDIPLTMYTEGFDLVEPYTIRIESGVPSIRAFKQRQHPPHARGIVAGEYNFRFDAIRFCHKVFVIEHAMQSLAPDVDALIWIDADTVTHQDVPRQFVEGLLPDGADVAYLSRLRRTSETGFVIYRNNSHGRRLVAKQADTFRSGDVYSLPEWHDAYVFDWCREILGNAGLVGHSLSGDYDRNGHPFINGPLGQYMDHLKGTDRKARGKSKEKDLVAPRAEAYWA